VKESRYNIWTDREDASYVFNGVSGALLRVRAEERAALAAAVQDEGNGPAGLAPTLLDQLIAGRMVVADDGDELGLLARRYARTRGDTSTFALTLVTSLGCNFDCPYCFEAKHHSLMQDEVQQAVLDVVDTKLPTIQQLSVTWFGGEPLVGRRAVVALSDKLIARCDAAGVAYDAAIVTNGYFLDAKTCRLLTERRVEQVQVGLDGPPEVHNRMRPMRSGRGSFDRIVANLHHAVAELNVSVRINLDADNADRAEELLQILANEGLAGKLSVYVGQLVTSDDGIGAPAGSYGGRCLTNPEFAAAELAFQQKAIAYGFATATLPTPSGAPCTAVRQNELVIGSEGEIYKCWDSVGNDAETMGRIQDRVLPDTRSSKWLLYDPFADPGCQACVALPVCMGGCAHHAMDAGLYDNRCGTFRHTYRDQVSAFVEHAESEGREADRVSPLRLMRRMETR
jgi:uncharacterized protein